MNKKCINNKPAVESGLNITPNAVIGGGVSVSLASGVSLVTGGITSNIGNIINMDVTNKIITFNQKGDYLISFSAACQTGVSVTPLLLGLYNNKTNVVELVASAPASLLSVATVTGTVRVSDLTATYTIVNVGLQPITVLPILTANLWATITTPIPAFKMSIIKLNDYPLTFPMP